MIRRLLLGAAWLALVGLLLGACEDVDAGATMNAAGWATIADAVVVVGLLLAGALALRGRARRSRSAAGAAKAAAHVVEINDYAGDALPDLRFVVLRCGDCGAAAWAVWGPGAPGERWFRAHAVMHAFRVFDAIPDATHALPALEQAAQRVPATGLPS
jgi:hypothetical protein